jgi:hypothetical protein
MLKTKTMKKLEANRLFTQRRMERKGENRTQIKADER